jgi:hypothetical protein
MLAILIKMADRSVEICSSYKHINQFYNTPIEAQGGEELLLLLIHDLGTAWG